MPSKYDLNRLIVQPNEIVKPTVTITYGAALSELLAEMEAKEGSELVLASSVPRFNVVPTGIFTLDMSLGGGWADGSTAMIYGYGNSGKTTSVLKSIAGTQAKYPKHKCVLVDVETTFDPGWAVCHGVDLTRLLILRPQSAEEGADIVLGLCKVDEIAAIFLDSIPTFVPKKDYEDSLSDVVISTRARLMGRMSSNILQAMVIERQARGGINPNGHWLSWYSVNSWRNKIGVMFGDPRTLPGGEWQHTFHMTKIEIKAKEETDSAVGPNGKKSKDDDADEGDSAPKKGAKSAKSKLGASVSHTGHEFVVRKAKLAGARSGEFNMSLDPHSSVGLGGIDDAAAVGAWAKRMGVLRQTKGGLVSDLFDFTLSGREEVESRIQSDKEFGDWLRLAVIVKQRVYVGLPPLPPDGYLLNPQTCPGIYKPVVAAPVVKPVFKPGGPKAAAPVTIKPSFTKPAAPVVRLRE